MTEQLNMIHVEESLSPRLAWMKKWNVSLCSTNSDEAIPLSKLWPMLRPFYADGHRFVIYNQDNYCWFGETEDDAIANFACDCGIPLWNEEQYAKEK